MISKFIWKNECKNSRIRLLATTLQGKRESLPQLGCPKGAFFSLCKSTALLLRKNPSLILIPVLARPVSPTACSCSAWTQCMELLSWKGKNNRKIREGKGNSEYHQTGSKFTVFPTLVSPGLDSRRTASWTCVPCRQKELPEKLSISGPRMGQEGLCKSERVREIPVYCCFSSPTPAPQQSHCSRGCHSQAGA